MTGVATPPRRAMPTAERQARASLYRDGRPPSRRFLWLLAAGLISGVFSAAVKADASTFATQPVAEGVYVHVGAQADANPENRGDIANISFVIGNRCAAVIDTGGSRAVGAALLDALRAQTRVPVCYVINTHMHPDHLFGNGAFATIDEVQFVGHRKLAPALAARRDNYLRVLEDQIGARAADNPLIPTNSPIDSTQQLDLGGRTLTLQPWPTAHTDNDLTVYDDKTGTLWTGDLLFVGRIPVIDGSVIGWRKAIDSLHEQTPRHVVPGHGPIDPPWPAALEDETRYLDQLTTEVRAALKQGRTLAQTIESAGNIERPHWLLFDDYNRRNATACYTELEWEE